MNLFKTFIFTLIVPGTVAIFVPHLILSTRPANDPLPLGPFHFIGLPIFLLGLAVYLKCAWDFATAGRGTPAPIDPPKELVVRGLYKYSRNAMYVGVMSVVLGEAFWHESLRLFIYVAALFLLFHTFVLFYEEPTLRRLFGESYQEYCKRVPRWIPRISRRAHPDT